MSSSENNRGSGGVGVCGLLGVAFVVLRLCGVIDWPWLWVLAPFWVPIAIALALFAAVALLALISTLFY